MRGGREGLVLGANSAVHLHPGMLVEVAADQIAEFGPVVISVGRAMRAQEALAIFLHEGDQRGLLLVVHLEFARRVERHGVEVIQVLRVALKLFLGDPLRVGLDEGVPQRRLAAQLPQRRHGLRRGVVLEPFHGPDHQQPLALLLRLQRAR